MMIPGNKEPLYFLNYIILLCLFNSTHLSIASDSIYPGESLSGNQTLTSAEGNFELGFFSPGSSQKYYIGIWYKNFPSKTVVWVANRELPVTDPYSSALQLSEDGNLLLLNSSRNAVWSSSSTSAVPNSTVANLSDDGNFLVQDKRDSSTVLWQSFDHPTDTWLPGGKLGYSKLRNEKQILTSWRSTSNPAPSLFSLEVKKNGTSHILMWNGSQMYWSSGEWTGNIFSLVPEIQLNFYIRNMTYVSNENERYFVYASAIPGAFTRFMIDITGQLRQFVWRKDFVGWRPFWNRPTQQCEVYAFCGANSICNQQNEPLCVCMEGFEPKVQENWNLEDRSEGCVRKAPLSCDGGGNDAFFVLSNVQFPANSESLPVESRKECESACRNNCSCSAFAFDNGCNIWKGELFNAQQLFTDAGRDIYLRLAASEVMKTTGNSKKRITSIVVATIAGFTILSSIVLILWRRCSTGVYNTVDDTLMLYNYRDLRSATKNFSEKLGEGGFGSVFKGVLPDSTAIAVKKLNSLQQGEKQFLAEVKTIGTIQHINLVRLRGLCVKASKRFLVYDYMPNGSLETLLFQKSVSTIDWRNRYQIAVGTARALSYLHEECRNCIIHCDIKPENILLDAEHNAKVADFGLAKIIGRDFSRALTSMRGTRGYLAPEWIAGEAITAKADVFSYGMLLCEIISGRRNSEQLIDGTYDDYFPVMLANSITKGEDGIQLLDERLNGNADIVELNRACKVACWCIQDDEKDRPTMRKVVQVLEGVSEIATPSAPRFLQILVDNASASLVHPQTSSTLTST